MLWCIVCIVQNSFYSNISCQNDTWSKVMSLFACKKKSYKLLLHIYISQYLVLIKTFLFHAIFNLWNTFQSFISKVTLINTMKSLNSKQTSFCQDFFRNMLFLSLRGIVLLCIVSPVILFEISWPCRKQSGSGWWWDVREDTCNGICSSHTQICGKIRGQCGCADLKDCKFFYNMLWYYLHLYVYKFS